MRPLDLLTYSLVYSLTYRRQGQHRRRLANPNSNPNPNPNPNPNQDNTGGAGFLPDTCLPTMGFPSDHALITARLAEVISPATSINKRPLPASCRDTLPQGHP